MTPQGCGREAIAMLVEADWLRAEAVARLVRYDAADMHVVQGFVSPERHLAYRADLSNRDASNMQRVVRFCAKHAMTLTAWQSGRLSFGHVQALQLAARGIDALYTEHEAKLLDEVEGRDVDQFTARVRAWRWRVAPDKGEADAEKAFDGRSLTMQQDLFGCSKGQFQLCPVGTETLAAALATRPDSTAGPLEPRSLAQRNADALIDMADCYLNGGVPGDGEAENDSTERSDGGFSPEPTGARMGMGRNVDAVIDIRSLTGDQNVDPEWIRTEFARTGVVPPTVLEQFMCDASWRGLIMDGPSIALDYTTATPDIAPGLRRAIQRRDRCCQFEGCDRSWMWCDVHHLVPKGRDGPTAERNLALVCRFHHTLIHAKGWQLVWNNDGTKLLTISP